MDQRHPQLPDAQSDEVTPADDAALRALLPLTPAAFSILLALAGGERHGYSIMQEIGASSQGDFRIGPGTLYRSIKQLLALRLIAEADERPDPVLDDERRRYYQLTARGRRVAQLEAVRLARLAQAAQAKGLIGNVWGADAGPTGAQVDMEGM